VIFGIDKVQEKMKSLYVIYIGGTHEKSFIELHDMRFIVAEQIEETYDELKRSWWGVPASLHLDAWGAVRCVDGYEVQIKDVPADDLEHKLYFVNLGGYDKSQFTELHKNVFVVAPNESKAKVKALKQILDWESHHRDYQFEIDGVISMNELSEKKNHFIHMVPCQEEIPFEFICKYVPIGK
jgi:hypothetical protein